MSFRIDVRPDPSPAASVHKTAQFLTQVQNATQRIQLIEKMRAKIHEQSEKITTLSDRVEHSETQCGKLLELSAHLAKIVQVEKMAICLLIIQNSALFKDLNTERAQSRDREDRMRALSHKLKEATQALNLAKDELIQVQKWDLKVRFGSGFVGLAVLPPYGPILSLYIADCVLRSCYESPELCTAKIKACEKNVQKIQTELDQLLRPEQQEAP